MKKHLKSLLTIVLLCAVTAGMTGCIVAPLGGGYYRGGHGGNGGGHHYHRGW